MNITLGTVQFGMKYGVTNIMGQTTSNEVEAILAYAQEVGILQLDTAPGYGNAEKILGGNDLSNFKIITKTPHFQHETISEIDIVFLKESFRKSLEQLNVERIYGLLVHNIKDCYKTGNGELFNALSDLKSSSHIKKIGVSVYEARDIEMLLNNEVVFDLVQIPLNVLDQRILKSGLLQKLKARGIEIHVRSVFLQGILLSELKDINQQFYSSVKPYFDELAQLNLTKLEGALLFIKQIKEIDSIVLGVNNLEQLKSIYETYQRVNGMLVEIDFTKYAIDNLEIVDPRNWK